jgi:uncharacterized membrane protein YebE (DUF533 family)
MSSNSNSYANSFDPEKDWRDAAEARKTRNYTKGVVYGGGAAAITYGGYTAYNKWNQKSEAAKQPEAGKQASEKPS